MGLTRWIFIRHGQAVSNAEGWYAGHTDSPLTERGRAQALEIAAEVAKLAPEVALASDLRRAHETARLALSTLDLEPTALRGLRERALGEWTRLRGETAPMAQRVLTAWAGRPPGGESLRDTARRAIHTLLPWNGRDTTVVVFAHGALIRALIGVIDGTPRSLIGRFHPTNCQILVRRADLSRLDLE